MKRIARLAPPEPPTQEDLEAGGLASSKMSLIYWMLTGGAPHGLTMIQVAQRLGWRRPTVQALLGPTRATRARPRFPNGFRPRRQNDQVTHMLAMQRTRQDPG